MKGYVNSEIIRKSATYLLDLYAVTPEELASFREGLPPYDADEHRVLGVASDLMVALDLIIGRMIYDRKEEDEGVLEFYFSFRQIVFEKEFSGFAAYDFHLTKKGVMVVDKYPFVEEYLNFLKETNSKPYAQA